MPGLGAYSVRCLFTAIVLLTVACIPAMTVVTPTPASDPEREAILSFTRQALQIEADRAELMKYFAGLQGRMSAESVRVFVGQTFLTGVPVGTYQPEPPHELEGMAQLYSRLLSLDSPPATMNIKDAFLNIYKSEIRLFQESGANPKITKDNVPEETRYAPTWNGAQLFRHDAYGLWRQILREHSVDPGKERVTGLG